jgi:uncharacterized membrane protein YcaP (DUF421 family)
MASPYERPWTGTMSAMWSHMFDLHLSLGEKVLRAGIIYLFLVVALRLVGKRELSQLNTLDFIVLLAVSNAVQNGLIGNDNSVTGALVGATTLFMIDGALAFVLFRMIRLRQVVEGTATVLIDHGELIEEALRQEELTHEDLLAALQSSGAATFEEVERASLEPSGKVVFVPKDPSQTTQQYADLRARLDHLTQLVESLQPGAAAR